MKSLYESILDSEETLIKRVKDVNVIINIIAELKKLFKNDNKEEAINFLNSHKKYFEQFFKKFDNRLVWEYHYGPIFKSPYVCLVDTTASKSRGFGNISPIAFDCTSSGDIMARIDYNYMNSKKVSSNVKYDEFLSFAEYIASLDIRNKNVQVEFHGDKQWHLSAMI